MKVCGTSACERYWKSLNYCHWTKWFTTMRSEGKPVPGPMTTDKAKSFYGMKITDKCTLSADGNKKLLVRTQVSIGTV